VEEIRCPNCGEVFQVDASNYAQILKQVRDKEFNKELEERVDSLKHLGEATIEKRFLEIKQEHAQDLSQKDAAIAEKEREILLLRAKIDAANTEKDLAIEKALSRNKDILSEKEAQIFELKGALQIRDTQSQLKEKSLAERYEAELKMKDEQIEYYKDFKARQSTKMVGESLEQHCLNQFNSLRMTAFPNAYFEKDNDAKTGSKGDFIFREAAEGTEFISIMFEMKNEMDTTATKHKNEDFFKELDKDRREKGCEYAVLVSLLEIDNEYYNGGIVDVSYKYPKMYVVRPQFFIPIITLLRNAALNSLRYQKELQIVRNQQVDIQNFEANMATFKESFFSSFEKAGKRFDDAISEIDKTIEHLQKVKEHLTTSGKHLNAANNKVEDLSIKKLTKNAPSVKAMFDALHEEQSNA